MSASFLKVGEVSQLLNVAPRTVTKWFDAGLLKGYRLPGEHGERRIYRVSFDEFVKEHNIPQPIDGSSDPPPVISSGSAGDAGPRARVRVMGFAELVSCR
jgi:excisionase family DNA binding protein